MMMAYSLAPELPCNAPGRGIPHRPCVAMGICHDRARPEPKRAAFKETIGPGPRVPSRTALREVTCRCNIRPRRIEHDGVGAQS
jgi:hypothetical protein